MDSLSKIGGLSLNVMCNVIFGLFVYSGGLYNYIDVMLLRVFMYNIVVLLMFFSINFYEFSENYFLKIFKFMEQDFLVWYVIQ